VSGLTGVQVAERLPHRPPILMVDSVTDWQAGKLITTQRYFAAQDVVFKGHFPDNPVMPGVLLVEALAQSAALLVNLTLDKTAQETLFLFMGIESARFRRPLVPQETLNMHVQQLKRRGAVFKFAGEGNVAGKRCVEATFMAKLVVQEGNNW
jgi:3-hydroxyacyl-[acyl-carrier-protein] dehydratase